MGLTKEAYLQDVSIDSIFVSVNRFALGAKKNDIESSEHQHIGISKGGRTTKIHAVVDSLRYPIKFLLSAGNVNELNLKGSVVLADKACSSTKFIDQIKSWSGYICSPCSNSFV